MFEDVAQVDHVAWDGTVELAAAQHGTTGRDGRLLCDIRIELDPVRLPPDFDSRAEQRPITAAEVDERGRRSGHQLGAYPTGVLGRVDLVGVGEGGGVLGAVQLGQHRFRRHRIAQQRPAIFTS